MTHSPVVAPRQVELLVSSLSGTIGATTDTAFRPGVHDTAGPTQTRSSGAVTGR
jgi:hypothetical protein